MMCIDCRKSADGAIERALLAVVHTGGSGNAAIASRTALLSNCRPQTGRT